MKIEKSGLSVMTYDFSTAILVDATGVDVIDAGASTLDALERFCEEVRDGRLPRRRALLLNQNDTIVEEK